MISRKDICAAAFAYMNKTKPFDGASLPGTLAETSAALPTLIRILAEGLNILAEEVEILAELPRASTPRRVE